MGMPKGIPVSERAVRVVNEFVWTLWPGTTDVLPGTGLSEDQRKLGLREAKEKKLVSVDELGCLLPAVPRLRFTEEALESSNLTDEDKRRLGADSLGNVLLYDFAKFEAVNAVSVLYEWDGWQLQRIHPYERAMMIAAGEYHHPDHDVPAYVVFCWASAMDTEQGLYERLEALPAAMQAQVDDSTQDFFPAGLAILAAGEWDATRALCMAAAVLTKWVSLVDIAAWYYGGGEWHMSTGLSAMFGRKPTLIPFCPEPTARLRPSVSTRSLGNWTLESIIASSTWAGRSGHSLFQLLTIVGKLPVGSVAQYQALAGEKPGGRETWRRLRRLTNMGLISVVTKNGRARRRRRWPESIPVTLSDRGQGADRLALTLSGRVAFCYAHGGRPEDLFSRSKLGNLETVVRQKALLHLLKLSWTLHLCYTPGVRPLGLSDLDEIARDWKALDKKDRDKKILVPLLTLSGMVCLFNSPKGRRLNMLGIRTQLSQAIIEDRWLYQHEDIVYDVLGQASVRGCSIEPGWMGRTTLADEQRIDPDGLVRLQTPWGREWCRLEVELSDRTYKAVQPRCSKCGSQERRDNLTVLVVCLDGEAERNFHLAAGDAEYLPKMLTTTLARLKAGGVFGKNVWSRYGQPVTLAP